MPSCSTPVRCLNLKYHFGNLSILHVPSQYKIMHLRCYNILQASARIYCKTSQITMWQINIHKNMHNLMALSHIAGSAIRTRNGWQRKSTVVRQMFLFMSRCSSFMPPNPKIFYRISNFVSRWIIFCIRRCTLTQSVNVWQGHYTLFLPVCMSNHIITFQNYSAPPLGDEHFYQVDFTIWIIILYSLQSYTIFFDCLIVIKKYYRIKWNKYTSQKLIMTIIIK